MQQVGPLLERSKWHHLAGKGWDPSLLTEFTAKEIESLSREGKEKNMPFFFGVSTGHSGTFTPLASHIAASVLS